MALFISADLHQPLTTVKPENGTNFTLEELYHLLHCTTIECVSTFQGSLMVCDEEAKLTSKPPNRRATELVPFLRVGEWQALLAASPRLIVASPVDWQTLPASAKVDWIAGDVLVCESHELA